MVLSAESPIYQINTTYHTLREAICKHFLPALFQGSISIDEEEILFLPVHLADRFERSDQNSYNFILLVNWARKWFNNIKKGLQNSTFAEHLSRLKETVSQTHHKINDADLAKLNMLIAKFSPEWQRALRRATSGTSSRLTSTPLERYRLDLSPIEFRDSLAVCYLPP